jgi:alpha-tubulin suppressor-like RCC1 family protein
MGPGVSEMRTPTMVPGVSGARSVVSNYSHTCVTRLGMNALCWGLNGSGQLGSGVSGGMEDMPVESTMVPMALYAGIGQNFTCMANDTSPPTCFGQTTNGRLGTDLGTMMMGGGTVMGGSNHGCAIDAPAGGGQVFCWGLNDMGQVGIPGGDGMSRQPVSLPLGATDLALGDNHSCVRLTDSTVRCWGANGNGQVEPGGPATVDAPVVPVPGLTAVADVSAGWRHSCVLTVAGRIHCWGNNVSGQLGNGTTLPSSTYSTVPTP